MRKGVKEYVIDVERRDNILADLKKTEKTIKGFNKERKSQFKAFKKMNAARETTREEFSHFLETLMSERKEARIMLVDVRIGLAARITEDEWQAIILKSGEAIGKRQEKAQKKIDKDIEKGREVFGKTHATIVNNISEDKKQNLLLDELNKLQVNLTILTNNINSVNVKEQSILARQDSEKAKFKQLAEELDSIRYSAFTQLIDFHVLVKENSNQEEWNKVMKQFNKDLDLTDK